MCGMENQDLGQVAEQEQEIALGSRVRVIANATGDPVADEYIGAEGTVVEAHAAAVQENPVALRLDDLSRDPIARDYASLTGLPLEDEALRALLGAAHFDRSEVEAISA